MADSRQCTGKPQMTRVSNLQRKLQIFRSRRVQDIQNVIKMDNFANNNIVKFHVVMEEKENDEESYSTILSSWIVESQENNMCTALWPPDKDVKKSLKFLRSPQPNWKRFDAEIVATYDLYEKARKKEAMLVANASSSEGEMQRKRKPKKKPHFDTLSNYSPPPSPPSNDAPSSNAPPSNVIDEYILPNVQQISETPMEVIDIRDVPIDRFQSFPADIILPDTNISQMNDKLDLLIKKIDLMSKRQIRLEINLLDLVTTVNQIVAKANNVTTTLPDDVEFIFDLPLKNINSILELDESTKNGPKKDALFNYFKNVGGSSERNAVQKCMSHLFTNSLSNEVSWYGRKGNFKIGHLQIFRIMLAAIRINFPNLSEKMYEQVIMDYLKLGKQRMEREMKQKTKDGN